jgi:predicted Zn-dependent protease
MRSFQPLTDPAALNLQPHRLDIVKLDRRTTIEALTRQRSSPAPAATLALINQVELQAPLEAGRLIKWVVGQPLLYSDSGVHPGSSLQLPSLVQNGGSQP